MRSGKFSWENGTRQHKKESRLPEAVILSYVRLFVIHTDLNDTKIGRKLGQVGPTTKKRCKLILLSLISQ